MGLIMAGGLAKRLGGIEKPLLKIRGKTMLETAVEALKGAGIKRVYVAVTPRTPGVKRACEQLGVETIETPGSGFVYDLWTAIRVIGSVCLVAVADKPFLTAEEVSVLLDLYELSDKPVLTAVTPLSEYVEFHWRWPSFIYVVSGLSLAPVGLSVMDLRGVKPKEAASEDLLVFYGYVPNLASIDTFSDLEKAGLASRLKGGVSKVELLRL